MEPNRIKLFDHSVLPIIQFFIASERYASGEHYYHDLQ